MRETQPHVPFNTKAAQRIIDARAAATADAQRRAADAAAWNKENGHSSLRFMPGAISDIDSRVIQQQYRTAIAQPTAEPTILIPLVDEKREYKASVAYRQFHLHKLFYERSHAAADFGNALGFTTTRETIEALHSEEAKKRFGESE